jgi:uncharacterized protein YuzE
MMRTSYDPEADAAFFWFAPEGTRSAATREFATGVLMDFDEAGNAIGIEVLNLRARVSDKQQAA